MPANKRVQKRTKKHSHAPLESMQRKFPPKIPDLRAGQTVSKETDRKEGRLVLYGNTFINDERLTRGSFVFVRNTNGSSFRHNLQFFCWQSGLGSIFESPTVCNVNVDNNFGLRVYLTFLHFGLEKKYL